MRVKFVTVLFSLCCIVLASSPVQAKQLLVFGDSLSSAYGVEQEDGWVALLAETIAPEHTILNASVSGEDTVTGLVRLPLVLAVAKADLVLIELGGNDGLRAYRLEQTRANLGKMIELAKDSGAAVVLVGIRVPPNYGPRYTGGFARLFPELAQEKNVAFLDLFIEDIALDPAKMQRDGIHPATIAQPEIASYVREFLQKERLLNE